MNKEIVPGVILVLSCHKHLHTRLAELNLRNRYAGWPVVKVIGDIRIDRPFLILSDNFIVLKCEDSYIHLMKKLVLAIKAVLDMYVLREGILRCGDDLVFNETALIKFLLSHDKGEYTGHTIGSSTEVGQDYKTTSNWMVDYYAQHPEDFNNPLHGLADKRGQMAQYNIVPKVLYNCGVVVYLSLRACQALIQVIEAAQYNIFNYYSDYGYPFIIEDIGVGLVMHLYSIPNTSRELYSDNLASNAIAVHTNAYK